MAVLLAKPVAAMETVNDLHGGLVNLARVLASDDPDRGAPKLYERLIGTLCSEELYERARREVARVYDCSPGWLSYGCYSVIGAYWFFILSWLGRNGTSGSVRQDFAMAVRWTPGGGSGGTRFVAAVDSIPAWHQRLRKVTILNRDAFDIIPRISDERGVVIYVDPPYILDSRSGSGGGSRYLHDFHDGDLLNEDDHVRLAEHLHRFKHARVVVSYYDHPKLATLYPTWTRRSCTVSKQLHLQNTRGAKRVDAPEVLLMNGRSLM
jgi:DNA adenine methylase